MFESFLLHIKMNKNATVLEKERCLYFFFVKAISFSIAPCFSEALDGVPWQLWEKTLKFLAKQENDFNFFIKAN